LNGTSLVVKGDLRGDEDVTIDGHVEGRIEFKDNLVTIGPTGSVTADVLARSVIVHGSVVGNVTASERVAVLASGSIEGDIVAPRVTIAETAHFRGHVDMKRFAPA